MALRWIVVVVALAHAAQPGAQASPQQSPSGLIVGQVVDGASGKPVSSAIVTLIGLPNVPVKTDSGGARSAPPRVLTGADGRFVFRDLPAASIGISAAKTGHSEGSYGRRRPGGPSRQLTLAPGQRVGDIVVRMWKQAAITGRVVDEAGEALVGIAVRAFRRQGFVDRRLTSTRTAQTDDRGMYRLAMLDPGEYVIGVVPRNTAVPALIAQSRAFTPTGRLLTEVGGAPMPGSASAIQMGNQIYILQPGTPTPATSAGRLAVYPPVFYPSVPDFAQASPVVVGSGEEREGVDLLLSPIASVRVSGTVSGITNGVGVTVRLIPAYAADLAVEGEAPATVADGSGAFTFPAVPPGEYALQSTTRLRNQGFAPTRSDDMHFADLPLTVGGTDIGGIVVQLRPGLRISGRFEFEGATSRPPSSSSVNIAIEPARGSLPFVVSRVLGSDSGTFSSAPLVAGGYYVRVTGSPRGWMFKSATLDGRDVADTPLDLRDANVADVVITFSDRWSGLSGTVLTGAGAPDAEAVVIAFPTDSQTWASSGFNPRRLRGVPTSNTGQYTFAVLPPGDYYVAALPGELASDWRDPKFLEAAARNASRVTIADGERPVQDLRTQEVR